MGIYKFIKWANTQTCYVIFFLAISSCATCLRGKQYFNENLTKCLNCTICNTEQEPIVIRPCAYNHDTECGTHEQLNKILETFGQQLPVHIRHMNKKHHRQHDDIIKTFNDNSDGISDGNNEITTDKYNNNNNDNEGPYMDFRKAAATEAPFTKAETIVWDWQSITMTLAVFSCILFFLVIALYSLHQARQWKKLKENFDADVEELSASLSLMAVASSEKGEILEPTFGPLNDKNCLNNRCVYLEQLLHVRKDTKIGSDTGNVYVEDSNPMNLNGKT